MIDGRTSQTRYWRWVNHGDDGSGNVTDATAARQRCEFLSDMSIKRLCVTVDAGQGKTKALEQAQYLGGSGANRNCLALLVQFSDLPTSKNLFLGNHPELADDPEKTPLLIRALQNSPATAHLRGREAWALLTRLIRLGRFTLLVDSLDQSARCKDADASCVALRDFLHSKPEVRCIVSGRPYAVQWHWRALFESTGDGDVWQFAMVDPFTPDEAKMFLGEQRYGLLDRLQADVISIPRALEMILTIPQDELPQIRTKSEVYLKSLEGMLNKAFEEMPATVGLERDKAWKLFALLAFEMLRQGYRAGQANAGVDPGRKDEFLDKFWRSQQEQLRSRPLRITSEDDLDRRLEDLLSTNENLVNPVLAWRGERRTVVHFYWRNQTLMDMFGALWITRYAEQDHEYDWFLKQLDKDESREVCQLTTEMPLNESPEKYVQAMRVVYDDRVPRTGDQPRRRWTEWIYRSWPSLLQAAGYLKKRTWEDRDLFQATRRAQVSAWGRVAKQRDLADSNPARELVLRFLGEFPKMCADHSSGEGAVARQLTPDGSHTRLLWDGKSDPTNKSAPPKLKLGVIPNFIRCAAGKYSMGEGNERHEVKLSAFLLQTTAVTVAQYRLFDPQHACNWSDDCPVTDVSWYDAWVFALWIGGLLPTEAQWEYACRAGTDTAYSFGGDAGQLEDYAWYDKNSDRKAHPVATRLANPWGLYDMHGNVWEWCWDWYGEYERTEAENPTGRLGGSLRVGRGGCWYDDASFCRSAYRCRIGVPGYRLVYLGFRLARAVSLCPAR